MRQGFASRRRVTSLGNRSTLSATFCALRGRDEKCGSSRSQEKSARIFRRHFKSGRRKKTRAPGSSLPFEIPQSLSMIGWLVASSRSSWIDAFIPISFVIQSRPICLMRAPIFDSFRSFSVIKVFPRLRNISVFRNRNSLKFLIGPTLELKSNRRASAKALLLDGHRCAFPEVGIGEIRVC